MRFLVKMQIRNLCAAASVLPEKKHQRRSPNRERCGRGFSTYSFGVKTRKPVKLVTWFPSGITEGGSAHDGGGSLAVYGGEK